MLLDLRPEPVPLVTDQQGVLRVAGSRVTLDAVVDIFQAGATPEEIAQQYPSLALGDVYAVVTYYLRHREQVDSYLEGRRAAAARIRSENEARQEPDGLRDRLLARRRA